LDNCQYEILRRQKTAIEENYIRHIPGIHNQLLEKEQKLPKI